MANEPIRIVLDSNILISAYVFGGKPELVLKLIITEEAHGVISPVLKDEFLGVLRKKFGISTSEILEIQNQIDLSFDITYPKDTFHIVKDEDDNRVLEAAVEGRVSYIITGDKELLNLKSFRKIKIVTATEFLSKVPDILKN
ncbi:putative toxin-antitoxin system toxin component, PIN family [Candidatus Daviesbacteria bacterium]|nr:putative toxin-antitoxin system toxin component, PIN family [Candidatus Daviesbacteria bacterium]